jgi:stearoyl-CoA desaturase (delta-9 desaturase)
MAIVLFLIGHHYASVFFQSFFLHRYAAHRMFTMSPRWERIFYLLTFVAMGASYLEPRAYAILHRMHHAYSDQPKDPHSPHQSISKLRWLLRMKTAYSAFAFRRTTPKDRFLGGYPEWPVLDRFGRSWANEIFWIGIYVAFYVTFATAWWQYLLLPVHWLMGRIHGIIVNWCGHKYGYVNFENGDKSRNTLPIEFFILGELFQNNHHKYAMSPNFAVRWFEFDPSYWFIRCFMLLGIVQLAPQAQRAHYP